ncbi:MAG: hypothetical protein JO247_02430 [Chloroflexi bacterium]|nr:hypothetical protein [Chloroflexota bacterium]
MSKILGALSAALLLLALFAPGVLAQSASAKPAGSVSPPASGAATAASPTAAASPGQQASASASAPQAAGAAQPLTAAAPAGVATPVGANAPQEQQEPISLFAYLLIALAIVWFLAAIGGIIRIMTRPTRGPYAQPLTPAESDRGFLTFVMPFIALITVAIIVVVFGTLFLWLAGISPRMFDTEIYPVIVDLFIIAFVMFVATMLALRQPGGQSSNAVH